MTWVIGMARHLIGGVLVADVRVSFKGASECDLIQKVHQVDPNVAIGFSGSVWFGFRMVEDLRTFAQNFSGAGCAPIDTLVQGWYPRVAAAWQSAPAGEQSAGCSLLVVGAEEKRGFVNRNRGFCLRKPTFFPEEFGKKPISIGSGSTVKKYQAALERDPLQWLKMVAQFNLMGGPLDPFGTIVGKTIARNPEPGISPHLHLCVVRCDDFIWGTNDRPLPRGGSFAMPPVAADYTKFIQMSQALGLASDAAEA